MPHGPLGLVWFHQGNVQRIDPSLNISGWVGVGIDDSTTSYAPVNHKQSQIKIWRPLSCVYIYIQYICILSTFDGSKSHWGPNSGFVHLLSDSISGKVVGHQPPEPPNLAVSYIHGFIEHEGTPNGCSSTYCASYMLVRHFPNSENDTHLFYTHSCFRDLTWGEFIPTGLLHWSLMSLKLQVRGSRA